MEIIQMLGVMAGSVANVIASSHPLERTLKQDRGNALCELGKEYEEKGDIDNAIECYKRAIKHRNAEAMYRLGHYYGTAEDMSKIDYGKMEHYLLMAIKFGYTGAYYELGLHYDFEKKYGMAKKYYLLSINHHHDKYNIGEQELAELYRDVYHDNDNALKYFLMASKKGSSYAMECVGDMYKNIKNDQIMANKYYQMSYDKGNKEVYEKIDKSNQKKDIIQDSIKQNLDYDEINLLLNKYNQMENLNTDDDTNSSETDLLMKKSN